MKTKYIAILAFLFLGAVLYAWYILDGLSSGTYTFGDLLQGLGVSAALFASVVALSAVDPKKEFVKINIETEIDEKGRMEYDESHLSVELKETLKDTPKPIISHRVYFRIFNNSEFTLKEPTLTFGLPPEKQHPSGTAPHFNRLQFHSNLHNNRKVEIFESGGEIFLSNSNLPYLNDKDSLSVWIRMLIGGQAMDPFRVKVSVNCKNAEGITKTIRIDPSKLSKSIG